MTQLRPILLCFLAGGLGVLLTIGGLHLYQDHLLLDAIRADLSRQQAEKK